MNTQAQAPGQPQAQAPVHPIHQETATHESLTEWVKNNPDNDPHDGTDLEAPKEPPKEEPKAEAKEEEPETLELDEEAPIFEMPDMEDKGKTVKVSLKQLREERMMKADYMRNIQKVKAEEAALQERLKEGSLKAQNEYIQRLEIQKQAVFKIAGVKTVQEIEALSRQDPAAAQQEFLRLLSVNQTIQGIEAEQRQAAQKIQTEQQAALQTAILKARETLESDIKGFNAELYSKVLDSVAKDYGFETKDVANVYDARLIKVFHDAYQYRQLQKAKPELSKKVVAVPKVVKPGSAQPQPSSNTAQEAEAKLKKTGRGEDFVAWYMANQKQKRK